MKYPEKSHRGNVQKYIIDNDATQTNDSDKKELESFSLAITWVMDTGYCWALSKTGVLRTTRLMRAYLWNRDKFDELTIRMNAVSNKRRELLIPPMCSEKSGGLSHTSTKSPSSDPEWSATQWPFHLQAAHQLHPYILSITGSTVRMPDSRLKNR